MGLVICLRDQETVQIGNAVSIQIVQILGKRVRVRIDAPRDMRITRPDKGVGTVELLKKKPKKYIQVLP